LTDETLHTDKRILTDMPATEEQILPKQSQEVVALFASIVDSDSFFGVADNILGAIKDFRCLAECAELARRREPGGAYYRAKFWKRSHDLLKEEADGKKCFSLICKELQVPPSKARSCVEQGEAISVAEIAVSNKALRRAPLAVFENALRCQNKSSQYLMRAAIRLEVDPDTTARQLHNNWCEINGSIKSNLDIIKPSDWWAFSHPKWRQEDNFPGSIPGEIYANALYYFAPQIGVVVDAMAGSGMLQRVYDDRERWQKEMDFDLDIHLFDLYPRREYIRCHDARNPLPVAADWIFLDPPYFGQSSHLYDGDLALATNYAEYIQIMQKIVEAMAYSLKPKGRLCLFLPKWSGLKQDDPNHNIPSDVSSLAVQAGLTWIDVAFVSRGRQQEPGSALKNISAKRIRRMRSDTCVLNVFEKA